MISREIESWRLESSEVYKILCNSRSANLWQDFYGRTSVKDTVAFGYSLSLFLYTIKVSIPFYVVEVSLDFFRPIFHTRSFYLSFGFYGSTSILTAFTDKVPQKICFKSDYFWHNTLCYLPWLNGLEDYLVRRQSGFKLRLIRVFFQFFFWGGGGGGGGCCCLFVCFFFFFFMIFVSSFVFPSFPLLTPYLSFTSFCDTRISRY